ncbi:MAG: hypothetical protein J6V50_00090, partial [Clostridia bacterium]|nr:hypothetical protein [Clostridia bacterium]
TVVMPKFVDSVGDEYYLYHTAKKLPDSVAAGSAALTFGGAKNTAKLPFTSLVSISGGNEKTSSANVYTKPAVAGDYAGFMFYIDAPEIKEDYTYTYQVKTKDPEGNDIIEYASKTSNKFHFAFYVWAYDASADKNTTFYKYSGFTAYTLKEGESAWKSISTIGYGMDLDSNFKGYVYVPFTTFGFANDDEFFGISIKELTASNNYTQNSTANYPLWGYIPEGDTLNISGSMLVKGEFGSTTAPDASSVVIEGEKYYYNSGKAVDASSLTFPTLTTGVIKTDMSTTTNVTTKFELNSDYGERSNCYGLSALTDAVGTTTAKRLQNIVSDYDNSARLDAGYVFPETIKLNSGGFIFYAELPAVEGNHEICFKKSSADGSKVNQTQATGINWYRLEDGSDEWVLGVTGTNAYGLNFGDYDAETGKSPAWSGYIYFPYNFYRMLYDNDELKEIGIGTKVYRTQYGTDEYPGTPLEEATKFSAVTHVTEFDPSTTLAYGDGGRLVDLATGEYIYSKDYSVADSPIGNSDLIKAGNPKNVLQMEYISDARMNATVMELGNSEIYGKVNAEGMPNGKLVDSGAVIKHPAIELSKSLDAGHTGQLVYINTPNIYTANGDGLAFYVKNDSDFVFNLRLGSYGASYKPSEETGEPEKITANSGYLDYYGVYYKLLTSDGKWQSLKGDARKMPIPANFEGYFYLDFSNMPLIGKYVDNEGTYVYNGFDVRCDDVVLTTDSFTISYPMFVSNFTELNAGIAFVNNAAVSQNLFTGDFEVQNDLEKDLNIGLLELVRAKGTENFADFRNDYLKYYMSDERVIEPCIRHESYYNKKCTKCGADIDVTGTLGNVMIMGDSISTYGGYSYGRDADYKPALNQHWYAGEQDNTDLTNVHQTWWDILISNMDATLAYNRSCSGSTIAEATWENGAQTKRYNSFNARLDEVLSHNELEMFGYTPEDIDTFIFFGGTNDDNRANIGEAKYSDWTAEDLKYFAPAYCRYIATVKANFPNAKIVSLVDTTLTQVADTQIAINEYYGITTVTINGFDEVAPHPTVKGMRQIEKTLRKALSE